MTRLAHLQGTSSTPLQLSAASMATPGSLSRPAETTSNLGLSSPGRQLSAALAMAELSSVPINPAFHAVNSSQVTHHSPNSPQIDGFPNECTLSFFLGQLVSLEKMGDSSLFGQQGTKQSIFGFFCGFLCSGTAEFYLKRYIAVSFLD